MQDRACLGLIASGDKVRKRVLAAIEVTAGLGTDWGKNWILGIAAAVVGQGMKG